MIARDSTSYPTLAVIQHNRVTDPAIKTAVYMLSWRLFQFWFHIGAYGHPSRDLRDGPKGCWHWYQQLYELVGDPEKADAIFNHLWENQRRSIEKIRESGAG